MTRLTDGAPWTRSFALKIARESTNVLVAEPHGSVIHATRKHGDPVRLVGVDVAALDHAAVAQVLAEEPSVTAIMNIKKTSHVLGTAKEYGRHRRVAVLTTGEAMSALLGGDPLHEFEPKHITYLRNALRNHDRVLDSELVCEAVLRIQRKAMRDLTVVVTKHYQMSVADVDETLSLHPRVDAIVNTNPNGKPTSAAVEHAHAKNVNVYKIGDLFGAINRAASLLGR